MTRESTCCVIDSIEHPQWPPRMRDEFSAVVWHHQLQAFGFAFLTSSSDVLDSRFFETQSCIFPSIYYHILTKRFWKNISITQ